MVQEETLRTVVISPEISNYSSTTREKVFNILSLIENGFKNGETIKLVLKRQIDAKKRTFHYINGQEKVSSNLELQFPTLDSKSNIKFVIYLKVLRLLYDQMMDNQTKCLITKRQIYYQDVTLFTKQSTVDQCIDNLASAFGCSIEQLGVVSSQKGLIFGNLEFSYKNMEFKFNKLNGAILIPAISLQSVQEDFKFNDCANKPSEIIIVEKESVFKKFCSNETSGDKIIITGKGFADRLTKTFLFHLTEHFREVPVTAFVDSDVYGSMIFKDYKYKRIIKTKDIGDEDFAHKRSIQLNEQGVIERYSHKPSCARLIYGGTHLLDKISQLGFLDISLTDLNRMKSFLRTLIELREYLEEQGAYPDKELDKIIREVQHGMIFTKKREME